MYICNSFRHYYIECCRDVFNSFLARTVFAEISKNTYFETQKGSERKSSIEVFLLRDFSIHMKDFSTHAKFRAFCRMGPCCVLRSRTSKNAFRLKISLHRLIRLDANDYSHGTFLKPESTLPISITKHREYRSSCMYLLTFYLLTFYARRSR